MSEKRPSVLFLAHLLPWPLTGGGQIKSYHTLRTLSRRYDVTLLAFIRRADEAQNCAPLAPFCRQAHTVLLRRSRLRDAGAALSALAARRSFLIARDDAPAMHRAVRETLRGRRFDAIHVDHLQMAQFVPGDFAGRVVLDHHNIEHRIPQRMAETSGNPLVRTFAAREWPRLRRFELAACRRVDRVLVVSDEDKSGLIALAPELESLVETVPIGVDTNYFGVVKRKANSKTLLSIGTMYWPPNVDSMLYFCREILPTIKRQVPEAHLNIVGAKPTPAIEALADETITVTGSVPDVRPWAEDCGAFVVPLRAGSGMRVKILNALAMGLPVVSTTVGAEGIAVTDNENILLADGPDAFAEATIRVLGDDALAARIAAGGRRLMAEQYAWDRVGERLLDVYERIVPGKAPART
jgi:sugar transferase (PEP-CTERM/EpsH1 system associated)